MLPLSLYVMRMKTTICPQSGFARQIDRYLNSVWYPISMGALCAFSGMGDSSRYTVCMGILVVTILLTVLFASDCKPLFVPMLMGFCALGKDTSSSYDEQVGDVMLSYNGGAFAFVIGLGVLSVIALLIRFWKDGTLRDIWKNRGRFTWSILAMDVAFVCNGFFSPHWLPIDLAYGLLMAFGFTFFYFICVSIARRGKNVAKFACQCVLCTSLLGLVQVTFLFAHLYQQGLLAFQAGMLTEESRNAVELGWGISTSISAYLVLGIPAAFYLAANHRYSAISYFLGFGIFICIVALASRGPIVAGCFGMILGVIGCCFGKNKASCRKYTLAIGCCLPVFLLVYHLWVHPLPQVVDKFLEASRFDILAEDGRPRLWARGLQHFANWPIFGVGFEKGAFTGYQILRNVFANMYHNLFIQFIAAMGVLGLAAYGLHIWQVGRLWRKPTANTVLLLILPLMIFIMSMVDNFFFYMNQQIVYCMFLAVTEREIGERK